MSATPDDAPPPDLAEVDKAIHEAQEAEQQLHDMAPFQLPTDEADYVENAFDTHDPASTEKAPDSDD